MPGRIVLKGTKPPWIRQRNSRRRFIAVGTVAAILLLVAAVMLSRHRDIEAKAGDTIRSETATAPAPMTPSFASPNDMPDSTLTPGLAVTTDATIVCRPGYATSIRPTGALWRRLKEEAYDRYRLPRGHRSNVDEHGIRHAAYEVDHLVPLELGGSPTDIQNIWPQSIDAAEQKDKVEHELHALVCSGRVPLTQAQAAIARDWKTAIPSGTIR
jgi:hypothetical protein